MILGKQNKRVGRWSYGVKLSIRHSLPVFEIFCYKLLSVPKVGGFVKERDIKGFWRMWWIEKNITTYAREERKGFRKGHGPMRPVEKRRFKFLSW